MNPTLSSRFMVSRIVSFVSESTGEHVNMIDLAFSGYSIIVKTRAAAIAHFARPQTWTPPSMLLCRWVAERRRSEPNKTAWLVAPVCNLCPETLEGSCEGPEHSWTQRALIFSQ